MKKLSKNSLLNIIGICIIFLTPWTHRLVYENLLLAWPEIDHPNAHALAMIMTVVALFIVLINRFG